MFVVVVEDDRGGLVTELKVDSGVLSIGRTTENDIVLPSASISRNHCRLEIQNGSAAIVDLKSSNGVYVDDTRIKERVLINENKHIRLGDYRLRLELVTPMGGIHGINTAHVSPDQAHSRLVVLTGKQVGREILLFEPMTTIGRIEENDVSLPDISVSRHHAQLRLQSDGSFVLIDLNSSNGTFHKGHSVSAPTGVLAGDKIRFGNIECLIMGADGGSTRRAVAEKWVVYLGLAVVAALLGILIGKWI